MTIREAKQRLIMPFCTSTEPSNEYLLNLEAYKMAIKALDYLPTTTSTDVVEVINYPIITCDDTISREKVKKWICKTCPDDAECQRDCDVIKGIDALPSVTPKSIECKDAISRADVITEMGELNAVSFYEANEHSKEAYYEIKNMIKTISPVTPSKPKGHWIETEYHRWRCSVCREKGMSEWDNIHADRTNFCPDCGAEMVEPQESEE